MIRLLRLENRDNALLRQAFSLPIAAACRLNDRIQPRFRAVYNGEIKIHACFDQAGSNHAAG